MRLRRQGHSLFVATPAKLNLFLELLGKRADGFHQIDTVMSTVSLVDELRFQVTDDGHVTLRLHLAERSRQQRLERDPIPTDNRNLVVRALNRLKMVATTCNHKDSGLDRLGMNVVLHKRIPSAAGLGGASSDAAAALVAGNLLWQLGLSHAELAAIAAELGSDIPFFLTGGTAVCRGRGEIIAPIQDGAGRLDYVIVKPSVALATGTVFSQVAPTDEIESSLPIMKAIENGNRTDIARHLKNRLSSAADQLTNQIQIVRGAFARLNCLGHQMSGSGSSYFGIFANHRSADRAARTLQARLKDVRVFHVKSWLGARQKTMHRTQSVLTRA